MRRLAALLIAAAPVLGHPSEEGVSVDAPPVSDGETRESEEPAPPSGFSGDVRWRTRDVSPLSPSFHDAAPSLRHRPYFYQRLRTRWGDRAAGGFLAVRPVPGPSLAAGDLRRNGVVKGYAELPGHVLGGDFSLSFGQGLVFYDALGEFVRPAWVQGRGFKASLSSVPDDHLRGGVARAGGRTWSALGFFSRAALDMPLHPDGTAARDLWSLREGGSPVDEEDLAARDTVEEKTAGLRLEILPGPGRLAVTAVQTRYAPAVSPEREPFNGASLFRGKRNDVWAADGSWRGDAWRAAVDAAHSSDGTRRGRALAATLLREEGRAALWLSLFDYSRGYFSRHGKGPSFETADLPGSLPANQRGFTMGARAAEPWGRVEGEAAWVRFPHAMGNGKNEDPVFPSQGRRERASVTVAPAPRWELSGTVQDRVRERYALPEGGSLRRQGPEIVRKARLESLWSSTPRLRWKGRVDVRWEREPVTGRRAEGKLLMGEVRWSESGVWSLAARWYAFHSPSAFLTTGVEEIWDGVMAPRLAGGMGTLRGASGDRYAVAARRRWGKSVGVWAKVDGDRRWKGPERAGGRHAWHLQADWSW